MRRCENTHSSIGTELTVPGTRSFWRGAKVQSRCALSGSAHCTVSLQRQMLVKQVVPKAVEDGCDTRVVDIPVV